MKEHYIFKNVFTDYYWTIDYKKAHFVVPFIRDIQFEYVMTVKKNHKKTVRKLNKLYESPE